MSSEKDYRVITTFGHYYYITAETPEEALEKAKKRIQCEGEEIKQVLEAVITYKEVWSHPDYVNGFRQATTRERSSIGRASDS